MKLLERVNEGDLRFRYVDWDAKDPDLCPEEPAGFTSGSRTGVSTIRIYDDRVELQDVWSFTMGHAQIDVDCAVKTFRRDDRALLAEVTKKFRPELVAEVAEVLGLSPATAATAANVPPVSPADLQNVFVDRAVRFGLELDPKSDRRFVSIPVSNRMTDYLEYYEIDRATFDRWRADPTLAHDFVAKAKRRELDHLLLLKPGSDRGWA